MRPIHDPYGRFVDGFLTFGELPYLGSRIIEDQRVIMAPLTLRSNHRLQFAAS